MKTFRQDFFKFKQKLLKNEHFALARYSDGELYILQNKELILGHGIIKVGDSIQPGNYSQIDHKHFNPSEHSEYRNKLIQALQHNQFNYYKGISCRCCVGEESFKYQIELAGGDSESLTWANIWVNGNYWLFVSDIIPILETKRCVFICNDSANLDTLKYVVKDFRVGYNAMVNDYYKIDIILDWISTNNIKDHIFLFSASTFSNLAIYELFKQYPNNSYIDIGTCLNHLIEMPLQRQYLTSFWNKTQGRDINKICIW